MTASSKPTSRAKRNKDKAQEKSLAGQPEPTSTPLTSPANQVTEQQVFAKMGRQGIEIDLLQQQVAQLRGQNATLEVQLAGEVEKESEGKGEAAAAE